MPIWQAAKYWIRLLGWVLSLLSMRTFSASDKGNSLRGTVNWSGMAWSMLPGLGLMKFLKNYKNIQSWNFLKTLLIRLSPHCSRVTRYNSFISQDLFHFPMLIHDGDTLNSPLNLKINGRILKNSNFFTYWKIFSEIYVLIYKTVAILIKLGINIVRICKESQHWSKNLWIKPD